MHKEKEEKRYKPGTVGRQIAVVKLHRWGKAHKEKRERERKEKQQKDLVTCLAQLLQQPADLIE